MPITNQDIGMRAYMEGFKGELLTKIAQGAYYGPPGMPGPQGPVQSAAASAGAGLPADMTEAQFENPALQEQLSGPASEAQPVDFTPEELQYLQQLLSSQLQSGYGGMYGGSY